MIAVSLLSAAVLQGVAPFASSPPTLVIGQKVRVRFLEVAPAHQFGFPQPTLRVRSFAGTLVAYHPYEDLSVHGRAGLGIGRAQTRSIDWVNLREIEVPRRRNALNALYGAEAGFGMALGVGLAAGLFDSLLCGGAGNQICRDKNGWQYTKRLAVYAVPAGLVIGFFSTRWRRVFRSHVPQL